MFEVGRVFFDLLLAEGAEFYLGHFSEVLLICFCLNYKTESTSDKPILVIRKWTLTIPVIEKLFFSKCLGEYVLTKLFLLKIGVSSYRPRAATKICSWYLGTSRLVPLRY